jgi:hypothetical protein
MENNTQKSDKNWHQHRMFKNGYGKFPYIILKAGWAMYMQIPIHFNANGNLENHPGTHLNDVTEAELTEYQNDKTAALHNKLIDLCKRIKNKVEEDRKKPCRMCLVEGPETAYYFENDEMFFNESIPSGGTLLTQGNEILAMNVPHYIS